VFGDLQTQSDGCRRFPPQSHRRLPLADFIDFLLIQNRPPWHLTLDILMSRTQFRLHSLTGATLACATVKPESKSSAIPVVKIVPQRPKVRINDGKTSVSINLCLKVSLRRNPVCPHGSGMRIILPTPLGQLFCGLLLCGSLHRLQTFVFAAEKNRRIHVSSRTRSMHLRTPAMTTALRGGGDDNSGVREGKLSASLTCINHIPPTDCLPCKLPKMPSHLCST
jgi:hypothetical protein